MQPYYYWIFKACSIVSKLQDTFKSYLPEETKTQHKPSKPSNVDIQFKPGNQ